MAITFGKDTTKSQKADALAKRRGNKPPSKPKQAPTKKTKLIANKKDGGTVGFKTTIKF